MVTCLCTLIVLAVCTSTTAQKCTGCYPTGLPYPGWKAWTPESTSPTNDPWLAEKFPDNFTFSTATAAFQIEGAWQQDGRGPSIWDTFCHNTTINPATGNHKCGLHLLQNGDVADDAYNKIDEDTLLMQEMGLKMYRFSLAWPRIIPTGRLADGVNMKAINHYKYLFQKLKAYQIEPMVTLFHWDLPQPLEDLGAWESDITVDEFVNYAATCLKYFGEYASLWLTFNEPWTFLIQGYAWGEWHKAPGIQRNPYQSAHNVLIAHARTYNAFQIIKQQIKVDVKVSMSLNQDWVEPYPSSDPTEQQANIEASYRAIMWQLGWFAHPLYKTGDYPKVMRTLVKEAYANSTGYELPTFPSGTSNPKGTYDFFGLNTYSTLYGLPQGRESGPCPVNYKPNYCADQLATTFKNCPVPGEPGIAHQLNEEDPACWPYADSTWLTQNPWGIVRLLRFINTEYSEGAKDGIYITENGVDVPSENRLRLQTALTDTMRVQFYSSYIQHVLKAITLHKVPVRVYTAWSLMDNFEWEDGYNFRFGLIRVNYHTLLREVKESACMFSQLIRSHGFPKGWNMTQTPTCQRWQSEMVADRSH